MNTNIVNDVEMVTFGSLSMGDAFEAYNETHMKCPTFDVQEEGCRDKRCNCFSLYTGFPMHVSEDAKVFRLECLGFKRVDG